MTVLLQCEQQNEKTDRRKWAYVKDSALREKPNATLGTKSCKERTTSQ
jgi:hypothetical protein